MTEAVVRKLGCLVIDTHGVPVSPLSSPVSLKRVGRGVDGNVFRAESETGEVYAVKKPATARARRASLSPEGRAFAEEVAELRHENVVEHMRGLINGDTIMEYVSGGSMLDLIERNGGRLTEDQTATLMAQTLNGLGYLHSKDVVHKDIKPANLLIDSEHGKVKISDIAGTTEERPGGVRVPVGTPVFLAPEVVRTGQHLPVSDIWSVGCSALQCLTGNIPWHEEDNPFCAMLKVGNNQHPPFPPGLSSLCQDFLEACFEVDAAQRPTAVALLLHPFLQKRAARPYRCRVRSCEDVFLERIPSVLASSLNDDERCL
mmetsp:Transcript_53950/g.110075  ORF Transcript_53950/g.110075 Transcript_53950/m.110075 type:complete len:316 (+) Transcript_53950:138-1085(+)|eukprot:CAMPEP_0181313054 /NCGR_PEP_ID=MMETSP1101-20121128/14039_1 /TAXON_ID=46948 /ORGANISM="Rhodomonas abbreviata, Strain Caron Lab Isolate" /LENGTH=315 /DNA_ID=CAMNT_0023419973 /DNA_START=138 /DNA_END=1085 /DNA_ORIENTATION=+